MRIRTFRSHEIRAAARERGSAYLVALLAFVVLTVGGLALTFATQTEMLVGSNERIAQRTFYAAESALHLAVARALQNRDKCPFDDQFRDIPKPDLSTDPPAGYQLRARLLLDPTIPVADPPCEYCQINDEYEYSSNAYYKVNHAVAVVGQIVGPAGTIVSQKRITDMIDVQPWDDNLIPVCPPTPKQFNRGVSTPGP